MATLGGAVVQLCAVVAVLVTVPDNCFVAADTEICNIVECPARRMCVVDEETARPECVCEHGLTGPNCHVIDPGDCVLARCSAGRTCDNTADGPQCVCQNGSLEPDCRAVARGCSEMQCPARHRCVEEPAGPVCACDNGWQDERTGCITPNRGICPLTICGAGQVCEVIQGIATQCFCLNGSTEPDCAPVTDQCLTMRCSTNRRCINTPDGPNCVCVDGYTGDNCDISTDLCSRLNCPYRRRCEVVDGEAQCVCDYGLTGPNCDVIDIGTCDRMLCTADRTCINGPNGAECVCTNGSMEPDCSPPPSGCHETRCLPRRRCIDGFAGPVCVCEDGWNGERCDVVDPGDCVVIRCAPGHACVNGPDGAQCVCLNGSNEPDCGAGAETCPEVECPVNHRCDLDSGECVCDFGWIGDNCDEEDPERCDTNTYDCESHNPCVPSHCEAGVTSYKGRGRSRYIDCDEGDVCQEMRCPPRMVYNAQQRECELKNPEQRCAEEVYDCGRRNPCWPALCVAGQTSYPGTRANRYVMCEGTTCATFKCPARQDWNQQQQQCVPRA